MMTVLQALGAGAVVAFVAYAALAGIMIVASCVRRGRRLRSDPYRSRE